MVTGVVSVCRFVTVSCTVSDGRCEPVYVCAIVCARPRVEVLDTGSLNTLLCMQRPLLKHPVFVGLFNVYFPRFPISHDHRVCLDS